MTIVYQINFLHEKTNMVHFDLHLENIRIDSNDNWIIVDFGSAKKIGQTYYTF